MIIQCTKKALDMLNIDDSRLVSPEGFDQYPESLFGWHANIVTINRRKVLVLMNNETRFPVVINRLLKKDLANLEALILEAIRAALRMEGISNHIIEKYLSLSNEISFSKTASRSMIAKLNNTIYEVECWEYFIDEDIKIQSFISPIISRMIQSDAQNKGFYPNEKMLESLAKLTGYNDVSRIMEIEHYQLKIKLNLGGHDIWRRVQIPAHYSFRSLHNLIQIVYDWQNKHLHEFSVERSDDKNLKILMDDDPEIMEFANFSSNDIVQERFISLSEIFSQHSEVFYTYDFGDSWEHMITLEKTITSTSTNTLLLASKGERPPEDVGGEYGFNEYLSAINNPNSPEHEMMKIWAETQKERTFSPKYTNYRLKNILHSYHYSENEQILDNEDFLSRLK